MENTSRVLEIEGLQVEVQYNVLKFQKIPAVSNIV